MHPTMVEWMEELTAGEAPVKEAYRFLALASHAYEARTNAALYHATWKARAGFSEVLAKAKEIVAASKGA